MDQLELDAAKKLLLEIVPATGSVGNVALMGKFQSVNALLTREDYWLVRNALIEEGLLERGRGRGGSVHWVVATQSASPAVAPAVPAGEASSQRDVCARYAKVGVLAR